ncbi:PAS domain S-box protein, partial [Myxococcota bacterium]|nr:PAS domain S-box protein [Myxococcota bacterium]
ISGRVTVAAIFILWGLHKLDYPFLHSLTWTQPWGYMVAAVLGLTASIATLFIYFQKTRDALRTSEERFRGTFHQAAVGIARVSPRGEWLEVNARLCEILGYTPEELRGLTFMDITHPEDTARDLENMELLLQNKLQTYKTEKRYLPKDGRILWVLVTVGCVRNHDGSIRDFITVIEDISERKRAEEERERLVLAVEQSSDSIVITDTEGRIQYTNPFFQKITGYSRAEALGQNPRVLKSGMHDTGFYESMWETLLRGDTWSGRIVNKKKNGELYTEESVISPMIDTHGTTINYVAVKRDITRAIELEQQFYHSQKMESVGQLAGGIAHDFNNLLQAILGYGELAMIDAAPESEQGKNIEEAQKAARRAVSLVRQLLAFSRRQVLEMVDADLNTVVSDMAKMLRRIISADIALQLQLDADLGSIRADVGQIGQILTNLCVNARDAMPNGGTLTIRTANVLFREEKSLRPSWAMPGRFALMSISDTGHGMDKETLEHIFEPFFTTKEQGKGTGLGLSTVYGLVRQHNGFTHVESEPGTGTIFHVYLPITDSTITAREQGTDSTTHAGTETILLAEDNPFVRELAQTILEKAGYRVFSAVDGVEALEIFNSLQGGVDLAILDVVMPRLGGRETYDALRARSPELPVVFASGYSTESIHKDFILDEGISLLAKPFNRNELLTRIRDELDRTLKT